MSFNEAKIRQLLKATPTGFLMEMVEDTVRSGRNLWNDPKNLEKQFDFALCVLGWWPGPGMALKVGVKQLAKNPELIFNLLRFILQETGVYGDAEKFIEQAFSKAHLQGVINTGRQRCIKAIKARSFDFAWLKSSSWLPNAWNKNVQQAQMALTLQAQAVSINAVNSAFDLAAQHLEQLVFALAYKLKIWKKKRPPSSAANLKPTAAPQSAYKIDAKKPDAAKTITPPKTTPNNKSDAKPKKQASSGKKENNDKSAKNVKGNNVLTGIIGEHMGDYWVAKQLGLNVTHDTGQTLSQKLDGPMTKITDTPRGTGFDSLWHTKGKPLGGKPTKEYAFAVYEYKASNKKENPTLGSVLGTSNGSKKKNAAASQGESLRNQNQNGKPNDKKILQMSDDWVRERLEQKYQDKVGKTSRHVLVFGKLAIAQHYAALATDPPNPRHHEDHSATMYYDADDIDQVEKDKQARRAKKLTPPKSNKR